MPMQCDHQQVTTLIVDQTDHAMTQVTSIIQRIQHLGQCFTEVE